MLAGQLEDRSVMVKAGRLPAVRGMAGLALSSQAATVRVGVAVTGSTVHWRALENTANMAAFTSHIGMQAFKTEGKLGMVHTGVFPAVRSMAAGAIGSKLAIVMIVLGMAGETFLRGGFQIMQVARSDMAGGTSHRRMFTKQFERHLIMVKTGAVRVHPIMASNAVRTKSNEVVGREGCIQSKMTITTSILVEG